MGQSLSSETAPPSREELTNALAQGFAEKCFTAIEFYSLQDVFESLADQEHEMRYLKEDTIARFLEMPDVLDVSPVVFQMMSFMGAFPFLQDAPAVLGLEQMIMVVTIMTERYRRVLSGGAADRRKLLFKSLAVYDRKLSLAFVEDTLDTPTKDAEDNKLQDETPTPVQGFAVDQVGDDDEDDEDLALETDELALAAFEFLDLVDTEVSQPAKTGPMNRSFIPADNFRKLVMLLLLIAPLEAQESLSVYSSRMAGDVSELERLRTVAKSILASFLDVEKSPGIRFRAFDSVLPTCFPFLFNGLNPLFEHFLFSNNLDLSKRRSTAAPLSPGPPHAKQPLLRDTGSIMNLSLLSQLSFFLPATSLFGRLRLLYSGDNDGFSMGSFETKVFNWRAPTILLVRGTRLLEASHKASGPETSFLATLPPRRFPSGSHGEGGGEGETSGDGEFLTFGIYVSQPWRHTHRDCFGDSETVLFQLEPIHDVFPASTLNKDYVSFAKGGNGSSGHSGLAFGCPPPGTGARRSGVVALGGVSLMLDGSFEFGCFTHDSSGGGAFHNSVVREFDFQDRFEVDSLEVWGCGGDDEAQHQAQQWAWEAREAEARRRINLGTGDIDADRALLEMAGLVGAHRSGGSMN